MRFVYHNGRFIPELEARVPIYDSGLQIGDMAFEVTRTFCQAPFRLRQHLERLAGTLDVLRIDCGLSLAELEVITLETLARNLPTEPADTDWQIIHNISRGPIGPFRAIYPLEMQQPTVLISCFPIVAKLASVAEKYATGVDLVVPRQPAIPPALLPTHIKTRGRLHYKLADLEIEAEHPGCWPVLVDPSGQLTEGTSNNFFLVQAGELRTPPEAIVLHGVTRSVVLELAGACGIPNRECRLTPADAARAEELFVTSTSIGILHARSFSGQAIGDGQAGPVTRRLRAALDREVGLSFAEQAQSYAARQRA